MSIHSVIQANTLFCTPLSLKPDYVGTLIKENSLRVMKLNG